MKQLAFILLLLNLVLNVNAQPKDFSDLYRQTLEVICNKNDGVSNSPALWNKTLPKSDTMIVQKESYLPDNLPVKIDTHTLQYLSKKEIDHYQFKGKGIHIITLSPVRKQGDIYSISSSTFGYSRINKHWRTFGSSDYTFHYNPNTQKFTFLDPIISM